jgi:hypothetical protein
MALNSLYPTCASACHCFCLAESDMYLNFLLKDMVTCTAHFRSVFVLPVYDSSRNLREQLSP